MQKIEVTELKKLVKKEIRKDIMAYEEEKITEIIEETWSTKKIRKELCQGQRMITELQNKGGAKVINRKKIISEATEFYRNLYKNTSEYTEKSHKWTSKQETETEEPFPPILKSEVEYVLNSAKTGKASGPNKIENETLKTFADVLMNPLTIILIKFWTRNKSQTNGLYQKSSYFIKREVKTN